MGARAVVPILLLGLAAAGCRSVTAAPEELRVYEVSDVLVHLDGVPRRGCCVLPDPAARIVIVRFLDGSGVEQLATSDSILPSWAALADRSTILEEPEAALLTHLRSRLAAADGGPSPCRLAVRGGTTLEARGTPAVLEVVERALAELR